MLLEPRQVPSLEREVRLHNVYPFTEFDWSVIFSSSSKYGTCENENSRASDKANIRARELQASTPYEFQHTLNFFQLSTWS